MAFPLVARRAGGGGFLGRRGGDLPTGGTAADLVLVVLLRGLPQLPDRELAAAAPCSRFPRRRAAAGDAGVRDVLGGVDPAAAVWRRERARQIRLTRKGAGNAAGRRCWPPSPRPWPNGAGMPARCDPAGSWEFRGGGATPG